MAINGMSAVCNFLRLARLLTVLVGMQMLSGISCQMLSPRDAGASSAENLGVIRDSYSDLNEVYFSAPQQKKWRTQVSGLEINLDPAADRQSDISFNVSGNAIRFTGSVAFGENKVSGEGQNSAFLIAFTGRNSEVVGLEATYKQDIGAYTGTFLRYRIGEYTIREKLETVWPAGRKFAIELIYETPNRYYLKLGDLPWRTLESNFVPQSITFSASGGELYICPARTEFSL